jgi:hypothetical protein
MRLLLGLLLALATVARADFITMQGTAPLVAGTIYCIGTVCNGLPSQAAALWGAPETTIDSLVCSATAAPGGGNSWAVTVQTADGITQNAFADAGFTACTIADTATSCTTPAHSAAWKQFGSVTYQVVTTGTPAGSTLQCALRVGGDRRVGFEGVFAPTTGTITVLGSISAASTNDYLVMMPLQGTFGSVISGLTCVASEFPGTGTSWTIRLRHWTGSWANGAPNCIISGLNIACTDPTNTEPIGNAPDGVTFRVTATGSPSATARLRCAVIYTI